MVRYFWNVIGLLAVLALGATSGVSAGGARPLVEAEAGVEAKAPVTILISIDGFKPEYLIRGATPNLNALAASGVSASMRPSFPTVTFPNHFTLVTGLRPDRSGVVGNRMEDSARPGQLFTMANDDPFWWTQAEPIWITAEKAGIPTATMFWPGSNVDFGGVRPRDWQQYAHAVNDRQRVDGIIDWLRRPAATRPKFLTLYFDEVDTAGHGFGPDSAEATAAAASVDAAIGRLRAGLAALGQPANLVIVADHGMAAISPDRVVRLDRLLPRQSFTAVADGPYVALTPKPGKTAKIEKILLGRHEHVTCYRKGDLPARLHYGRNPRVPPIVCLAETGWLALTTAPPADHPPRGGAHGFDSDAPEMRALFIASGPAIKPAGVLPSVDNVDVAPLLRDLIGLPAASDLDGDDSPFREILVRP